MGIYINHQGSSSRRDGTDVADGMLIVDKPGGVTSHDVVARVRRLLKTRRVGHTGTLDPFATGVLVVCLNRATRLVQFLTGDDKEYIATVRLGYGTDTGDLTGTALAPAVEARDISLDSVRAALAHFRGRISQVPPMYSAKKIGGVRLYEMARRGEQVVRQPVEVQIKELELLNLFGDPALGGAAPFHDHADGTKDFNLRVVCSSGTYIRTLAEDIGQHLGVGAHLIGLRRTRVGGCDLGRAVTLERLAELSEAAAASELLIPMAEAVAMPELQISETEQRLITQGRAIRRHGTWHEGERIKLCGANRNLVAVAEYDAQAQALQPRIVLV